MLKGELEHVVCWQQRTPGALQHESKLRAHREPSPGLASLPPLPLATGAELELLCLWKLPPDLLLLCKLLCLLWAWRRLLCCCLVGKYLL